MNNFLIPNFFKKTGYRVFVFFLALSLISRPIFFDKTALAATLNPGSNFTVCTGEAVQPFYTSQAYPNVTLYWTFTSAVNTQKYLHVQIDDNPDFSSLVVNSGQIYCPTCFSYSQSSTLSFNTRYYWRLQVTDNLDSMTDWINGDSFITLKQSLMLKGNIKLWGNIKLE
ncbi:MAG TPA: hypothetical protein P5089_03840 [Candidatus Portnoybacteria bacterium]|nr:hypothetical protein [Candidatus Portnoybacteria bacterium]